MLNSRKLVLSGKCFRTLMLPLVAAALLSGCVSTGVTRGGGTIETQENVGFTVTEDPRVSGAVRADYLRALDHLENGRYERGIELLVTIADRAPELSAPRIDLGVAYHRSGELEKAEIQLLQALESHPDHPVALNELGIVYRKTGRFDQARTSYESALVVFPGFHHARRNLAILCDLYLADLDCALENYEAYMNTVPGDEEASIWISDIRARLAQAQ